MEKVNKRIKIDDEFINQNDDLMAIIAPVWWTATIYNGEEKYNESLAAFSQEQRNIYAILWYLVEVENGGHKQFYFNSTGIVWKDALSGLKELKLDDAAEIIKESTSLIGGEPSLDRATRQMQLKTYKPDFNDLDSRLYKLDNKIYEGIYQYILKNRSAFYFEGEIQVAKNWDKIRNRTK